MGRNDFFHKQSEAEKAKPDREFWSLIGATPLMDLGGDRELWIDNQTYRVLVGKARDLARRGEPIPKSLILPADESAVLAWQRWCQEQKRREENDRETATWLAARRLAREALIRYKYDRARAVDSLRQETGLSEGRCRELVEEAFESHSKKG